MLTDAGQMPDTGVIGILIAHLGALGSGELKSQQTTTKEILHVASKLDVDLSN